MGKLFAQLKAVAEIWPLKDGTYRVFLAFNIGKNVKFGTKISSVRGISGHQIPQKAPFWFSWKIL